MYEQFVVWLLTVMATLVPHNFTSPVFDRSNSRETVEETRARFESIAQDLATVVQDPAEPVPYRGKLGRARTAVLMLAIAKWESAGFKRSVDYGTERGDGGASWCLMQVQVGAGKTAEGWAGQELVEDRTKCFRAALHILRTTWGGGGPESLTVYASGQHVTSRMVMEAQDEKEQHRLAVIYRKSTERMGTAKLAWNTHSKALRALLERN